MNTSIIKDWQQGILTLFSYVLIALALSYLFMRDILFNLNSVQLDRSGDGFKNYFAFAYQYNHGEGLWFEGMQYPYGDLLSFADGQPIIYQLFSLLKSIGIDITGHELFVVQSLPILGIILGGFILHKIMRLYDQSNLWSFVVVTACLGLSPQIFRFNSHFALAYMFCFPLVWYMLIKSEREKISKVVLVVVLSALLLIYGFIHPYHLLICAVFLLAYFGVKLLVKKFDWHVALSAIIPIILFLTITNAQDIYDDRTMNPWGSWLYKTEAPDFLPFYGWFSRIFDNILPLRTDYTEGYVYLGILVFVVPSLFTSTFAKKDIVIEKLSKELYLFISASVLVLMFAMGIHLYLTDNKINDWIPTLKHFRSLGRFSWPFYYIAFISLAIYFNNILKATNSKYIKWGLLSFVLIFWFLDVYKYTAFFNRKIEHYKAPNELYQNTRLLDALKTSNLTEDNFQGIIPLPISTEGAEKFNPRDNWFVKTEVIPFSFQTGIPFVGAYMSRTSLSRILKQYQLSCSPYIQKEALEDCASEKDFLIVVHKDEEKQFEDILNRAYFISETEENKLYGISIDSLSETKTIAVPDSISQPIYYDNFDNENQGMLSNGSLSANGETIIQDIKADSLDNINLMFSIWYRIDPDKSNVPLFSIRCLDVDGNIVQKDDYNDKSTFRFEVIGNWVQIKKELRIAKNTSTIRWIVNAEHLSLDHALVTSENDLFYKELGNDFAMMNHIIGKKE
ncbi:MAG: hypothetical protein HKO66_06255 [Saprospiraceae bacterium]|nr:hypothetical protein [Bacteroidia bacterium]NNL91813.1 hypothetical protein [Saprospiraceae bacterium]